MGAVDTGTVPDPLDLVLDLVEAGRSADPGPGLPWTVLEGLRALVPCDAGIRFRDGGLDQWLGPQGERSCSGGAARPAGEVLVLPLGPLRCLLLLRREGPPFTVRERAVIALLRPHLQDLQRSAEERRRGRPVLTDREWQVLALSGSGCSNAEIATRLGLSIGTVRKHMEHVLHRLDVHSRGAAAAVALPHVPEQVVRSWSLSADDGAARGPLPPAPRARPAGRPAQAAGADRGRQAQPDEQQHRHGDADDHDLQQQPAPGEPGHDRRDAGQQQHREGDVEHPRHPGLRERVLVAQSCSTTASTQAVSACTSSGSIAGNIEMRSWLRPSLR